MLLSLAAASLEDNCFLTIGNYLPEVFKYNKWKLHLPIYLATEAHILIFERISNQRLLATMCLHNSTICTGTDSNTNHTTSRAIYNHWAQQHYRRTPFWQYNTEMLFTACQCFHTKGKNNNAPLPQLLRQLQELQRQLKRLVVSHQG